MNKKEKAEKTAFKYGLLITDEPSLYRLNIIAAIMSMGADRDNWVDMWRKACELIKFYKRFYEKERKVTAENLQLRKKLRELQQAHDNMLFVLEMLCKDDDWRVYDAVDEDFKILRDMAKKAIERSIELQNPEVSDTTEAK